MTSVEQVGSLIQWKDGQIDVPVFPVIPYIEGDGIGPDIWRASVRVFDAAVAQVFDGARRVVWSEGLAGQKAKNQTGEWLPADTLEAVRQHKVAIKGPLTTPVGGGIRSLNVTLRQVLDLYACVRPVRYFKGTPSPVRRPELMELVIFRENTEDVYAGIEGLAARRRRRSLSSSCRGNSAGAFATTRASGSNRYRRRAANAWSGWPSSMRSTTGAAASRWWTRATS